jgi:hypothetical protein
MNLEQASSMVNEALEQRRKFGKHFTVSDMPPEFLDALVIEVDRLREAAKITAEGEIDKLNKRAVEQHDEIVLLKRQLGAAKARETQLRKQLAKVTEQTEV